MRLGEVCLLTDNVPRLADFYRRLLQTGGFCGDEIHQTVIAEETMLTVLHSEHENNAAAQNVRLAFTVDDVYAEYKRLSAMGTRIIEKPQRRPWGAVNMSLHDPDGNEIYLRSFETTQE